MSQSEYDETRDYDDIDPEYRFDLTRIYETPADWNAEHEALDDRIEDLRDRVADVPMDPANPAGLRGLLEAVEDCYRAKQRLELYAKLAENVNQGDEAAEDRLQRFQDLEPRLETAVGAVRRRFAETDDERLEPLLEATPVVERIEPHEDRDGLVVWTDDPDTFADRLPSVLDDAGIGIRSMRADNGLEEAFLEMIESEEGR